MISHQHYLANDGEWILRAQGSSNENGCSAKDEIRAEAKATLAMCKDFCKDARFLQHHASTHCGCYKGCDFQRPASEYDSIAAVYERLGMISSAKYKAVFIKLFVIGGILSHGFYYL